MSQNLSGWSREWLADAVCVLAGVTPARVNKSSRASGLVISSHGLKALNSDGWTVRTQFQKRLLAGSNSPGPRW